MGDPGILLFLLVPASVFTVVGLLVGWIKPWGPAAAIVGTLALWAWSYGATDGELTNDGSVDGGIWAAFAVTSACFAYLGSWLAGKLRDAIRSSWQAD